MVERPWGTYEVLLDEPFYKVKRIVVKPGKRLSYQSHVHRDEHWTIVRGNGTITLNDVNIPCISGQHFHIPRFAKHRIQADPDHGGLVFIEVQTGDYTGEDDIVRYEDDFGRATKPTA